MLIPIKTVKPHPHWSEKYFGNHGIGGLLSPDATVFRQALSSVRIGRTFKTTARNRLPVLTTYLASLNRSFGRVIDIGASDGSASLSLIENLEFDSYWLTDKYIELALVRDDNRFWLYDLDGVLHMYQKDGLLFYLDPFRQWGSPLERLITSVLGDCKAHDSFERFQIVCLSPEVTRCGKNYQVLTYDCDNAWTEEPGDLILVANLLDKFIDKPDVMKRFCANIRNMVAEDGILVVADNDGMERATVFHSQGQGLTVGHRIGGGSVTERKLQFLL